MKNILLFTLMLSQVALATETTYPGTPSDMAAPYIMNNRAPFWPVIKKADEDNEDQRNSQLPPQIRPRPTGE